ncbi:MAG: hypothetical protein ACOYYF_14505 [Chloroflexota bacterium]|nr:hypothetical protein [Chloroflexota bacterium]MBI5703113.1 hypothetical protein [Chloroflexota bacterium]
MLREEMLRAIRNKSFLLSIALALFSLTHGFADYIGPAPLRAPDYIRLLPPFYYNAYDAVIWAEWFSLFGFIAPLIAVLPFSDSLGQDRTSGFLRFILSRSSYRLYFVSKSVAAALAGGLAVSLPILLLFALSNVVFKRGINLDVYESKLTTSPDALGPFGALYHSAPDLYILSLAALGFVFGAVYALLGLSISAISDNRYISLATPFLAYMLVNFAMEILGGLSKWIPLSALLPFWYRGIQWKHIGLSLGIALGVSMALFLLAGWLKQDR